MNLISRIAVIGLSIAFGTTAYAFEPVTADRALSKYCEPLIEGASAEEIRGAAIAEGFRPMELAGQPVLVYNEIVLGVSDNPRVCLVQAPPRMTFAEGITLGDEWAARYADSTVGAATRGSDGARVKAWTVASKNMALVMSEQTGPAGVKLMVFILGPMPGG